MKTEGRRLLYLHGTFRTGKSHVVAALACYLVRNQHRVMFLANRRPLAKALVRGMRLQYAFTDKPHVVSCITKIRVAQDVEDFYNEIADSETIYFLIVQVNALERRRCGQERNGLGDSQGQDRSSKWSRGCSLVCRQSFVHEQHGKASEA